MSRIPDQEALGVKIPQAVRQLERFDPSAMAAPGRALQSVGKSIAGLGESIGGAIGALDAQNEKADEYATHTRFLDFDQAQSDRYESESRNMAPDGANFRDTITKNYDDGARAFFKEVPDKLKPKYDYMLRQRGVDYERRARDAELKQNDTFHFNDVNTRLDAYRGQADENPDQIRDNIGRGLSLIDASRLPPQMKDKLKRDFTIGIEKQSVERRLQRGDDPLEVMKDLQARPKIQEPLPGDEPQNDRPGGLPKANGAPQPRPRSDAGGGAEVGGLDIQEAPIARTVGRPREEKIAGFVIHETQGSDTANGNLSWSNKKNTGANYYIDKSGQIIQWAPDNVVMNHAGVGRGGRDDARPDFTNANTLSVEIMTRPDERPNDAQVEAAHRLVAAKAQEHGFSAGDVYGHGELAPGHRESSEGMDVVSLVRKNGFVTGAKSIASGSPVAGTKASAPNGRISPETMGAVASVAKNIGADPSAIGAVFTMESGPNWNPETRTGSYRGVSQIGPDTLREMGVSADAYGKMSQAEQAAFYGKWLEHYNFSAKMKDAGIDFAKQKPERQAAILQAFQFAPNGDWIRRLGSGDVSSPVTGTKQARALGDKSIASMERYFSGNMPAGGGTQVAARSEDRGQMLWKQGKEDGAHREMDGHDSTLYDENGDRLDGTSYYRDKPGRYVTTDEVPPGKPDLRARALTAQGRNDMKVADASGTMAPTPKSFVPPAGSVAQDGQPQPAPGDGPAAHTIASNGMPVAALTNQGQVATILDGIPDDRPLSDVPRDVQTQLMRLLPPDAFKAHQMPDGSKASAVDAVTVGEIKRAIAAPVEAVKREVLPEAEVKVAQSGRPIPTYVDNPPYRWLKEADRETLLHKAEIAMRNKLLTQAQGEVANIKEFGEESRDPKTGQTFLERARELLMPNQYEKARIMIEGAKWHHQAVSVIKTLPESDIDNHIASIRPSQADSADLEKYKIKSDAYNAALKERDKIEKLRDANGALAADADPNVQAVWQTIRNAKTKTGGLGTGMDGKPQAFTDEFNAMTPTQAREQLVEARLKAQERFFGSKTDLRIRTITRREAEDLLGLRNASGVSDEQLLEHMKMGAQRADQMYGQYADRAFKDAVAMLVHNKESADNAAGIWKKQLQGRPVGAGDLQRYQMMQDMSPSQQFLTGSGATKPRAPGVAPTSAPRSFEQAKGPSMDGMRPGPGPVQPAQSQRPAIMDAAQIGAGARGAPRPDMARGAEPVTINQAGPRAIQWLMQAPTDPRRIQQFDSQFGEGSAKAHLDWLKAQAAKQPGMMDKLKGFFGR